MKVGILGNMLGASLLQMLARGGWTDVGRTGTTTRATAKEHRARKSRVRDEVHSLARRTTDKRPWHDSTDAHQAARIEAAAAKRARKAVSRERSTLKSDRNAVHLAQSSDSLNPFYIAK